MVLKTHGFNAKIGFEKYAPCPEISAKMSKILRIWFGDLNLDTFRQKRMTSFMYTGWDNCLYKEKERI